MGITVFRNGSLARERVRDESGLDWIGFSEALRTTEPGNGGAMMLPWFEPEITPSVPHALVQRIGLDGAPPARHVRAIVEAQTLAMARHSMWMGITPRTIYATGGASANREILQVVADVFNADVYPFDSTDSPALGAALRACVPGRHESGMGRCHRRIRQTGFGSLCDTDSRSRQHLPPPHAQVRGIRSSRHGLTAKDANEADDLALILCPVG
jgi:sugar (pentulose or hexulose) kinase